jgi:hypothetical protein
MPMTLFVHGLRIDAAVQMLFDIDVLFRPWHQSSTH